MWTPSLSTLPIVLKFISTRVKSSPSSLRKYESCRSEGIHGTQTFSSICVQTQLDRQPPSKRSLFWGWELPLLECTSSERLREPIHMNEAAVGRQMRNWGLSNPRRGSSRGALGWWGPTRLRTCQHPLPAALSKMQYLDPEELLCEEEDDVFGEGKPSWQEPFSCTLLRFVTFASLGTLKASWWLWISV